MYKRQAKVRDGFVTLTGEVEWHHQRQHILKQVEHVGGIREISNQIILKTRPTTDNVKREIEAALQRKSETEARQIQVSVSGDTVTLDGQVTDLYERDLVKDAAWSAPGVRTVVDKIRVSSVHNEDVTFLEGNYAWPLRRLLRCIR